MIVYLKLVDLEIVGYVLILVSGMIGRLYPFVYVKPIGPLDWKVIVIITFVLAVIDLITIELTFNYSILLRKEMKHTPS